MKLSFVNGNSWDWEHLIPQACASLGCEPELLFEVGEEWARQEGHQVGEKEQHYALYLTSRLNRKSKEEGGEGPRIPTFLRRFIADTLNLKIPEHSAFSANTGDDPPKVGHATPAQVIAREVGFDRQRQAYVRQRR